MSSVSTPDTHNHPEFEDLVDLAKYKIERDIRDLFKSIPITGDNFKSLKVRNLAFLNASKTYLSDPKIMNTVYNDLDSNVYKKKLGRMKSDIRRKALGR